MTAACDRREGGSALSAGRHAIGRRPDMQVSRADQVRKRGADDGGSAGCRRFGGPTIPRRGFSIFNKLRRVFRAIADSRAGRRENSAMLGNARRRVSKHTQAGGDVRSQWKIFRHPPIKSGGQDEVERSGLSDRRAWQRPARAGGARMRRPPPAPRRRGPRLGGARKSGRGLNFIKVLRQDFRAIVDRRGVRRQPSALMLRSDAKRRVSKHAPGSGDLRALPDGRAHAHHAHADSRRDLGDRDAAVESVDHQLFPLEFRQVGGARVR